MLRLAFAVLACVALFLFVGVADLLAVVRQAEPIYILYLLLLSVAMIWASCLKWRLFIKASGADVPMARLMKFYTISYFFNTFSPSYIGGDVARSYQVGRYMGSQRDALVATFLERFTGLLAMSMLGLASVCVGAKATEGLQVAIILVALAAGVLAAACFLPSFGQFCFALLGKVATHLPFARLSAFVEKAVRAFDEGLAYARNEPELLWKALGLSFFFHILTVLNTYLAARAVGWEEAPVMSLFVVVPLVLLVSMLPITPGGLGLQEGAFLFLLKRIGATEAQGLSVGLLLRAKVVLLALFGWALLFFSEKARRS